MVAQGKKVRTFNMKSDAPDDAELLKLMLGRSGSLRAPTLRRGTTLLVGFNADAYKDAYNVALSLASVGHATSR